jgi:DNA-binding transcriptional ArsR family regulator
LTKPIIDIDDPRLVKALAHPLRIRVMSLLEQRSATPKEMALELGVPLENLSYHVRTLRDFGFIKLERRRMVRGAVEHRYGLAARPQITAKAWEQLPAAVREALDAASLDQIWDIVSRAAAQNKMARAESHLTREYVRLDEEGFAAASQIISDAVDKLMEVEKQAAKRLRTHDAAEVPTVLIAMLFDAPDPAPAPERAPAAQPQEAERSTP